MVVFTILHHPWTYFAFINESRMRLLSIGYAFFILQESQRQLEAHSLPRQAGHERRLGTHRDHGARGLQHMDRK
jgi:hypothetical protein